MKECRPGWIWKSAKNGGFWVKENKKGSHKHKLSFFCPCCSKITGTIDDNFLQEYGICAECYVMYVENRKVPAIDLSKFKK